MEKEPRNEIVRRETYGGARRPNFQEQRGRRTGTYQPSLIPETVEIYTNFFELVKKPDWHLYQYHVDFEPPIESKGVKIALVKSQNALKNSVFDGSTLFTTMKFNRKITTLTSVNPSTKIEYKIIIKKTADIYPSSEKFEIEEMIDDMSSMQMNEYKSVDEMARKSIRSDRTKDFIRFLNLVFKK
jgi:hypothetical protein